MVLGIGQQGALHFSGAVAGPVRCDESRVRVEAHRFVQISGRGARVLQHPFHQSLFLGVHGGAGHLRVHVVFRQTAGILRRERDRLPVDILDLAADQEPDAAVRGRSIDAGLDQVRILGPNRVEVLATTRQGLVERGAHPRGAVRERERGTGRRILPLFTRLFRPGAEDVGQVL